MAYSVEVSESADKEFIKIQKSSPKAAESISSLIKKLEKLENPFVFNCKKMRGFDNRYRWRAGDYRIIGEIYGSFLIIKIIKIAHRQKAYKK